MNHDLFPDFQAFTDAWHHALSHLNERDQDILASVTLRRESKVHIAQRHSISHQRVVQLFNNATARFLRTVSAAPDPLVNNTLQTATRIVDAAGIELALTLRSTTDKHSHQVADQLVNIDAIAPHQAPWAIAALTLAHPKRITRPSLSGLIQQTRQIAGQHHLGITPHHLFEHLTAWHETITAWPGFDLALHIQATTGITPDAKTGAIHPVRGWTTPIHADPNLTSYYTTLALTEANRCLTIPEIVQAANDLAQRDDADCTYSDQQVRSIIHVHKQFRWAGPGTYGLTSWDVGHSSSASTSAKKRVKIGDEIVHLINSSSEPVVYHDIKVHILNRFNVSESAVQAAIYGTFGKEHLVVHPDRSITLRTYDEPPPPVIC